MGWNQPAAGWRDGSPAEVAERARQTFEASLERIKPAAAAIIAKIRELSDKREEIGVEFGIKLSAEAGVVIASTGSRQTSKSLCFGSEL
jgi:NTP-dependent ternary system trypsin peptidase co-occuring protein